MEPETDGGDVTNQMNSTKHSMANHIDLNRVFKGKDRKYVFLQLWAIRIGFWSN